MSQMFSVSGRFQTLELRIKGIEDKLSQILSRLTALENPSSEVAGEAFQLPSNETEEGDYVYRSLDGEKEEIRVLVLYSGQEDVVCELVHGSLDWYGEGTADIGPMQRTQAEAMKKFNTLSYTWGSSEKKGSVIIEGHRFPVTENLESALRNFRNFKDPSSKSSSGVTRSFWWIDAICINQEDVLERNQQVNLMTRIYKKAVGVHIWLGEQADDSEVAFQVAHQLAHQKPQGPGHPDIVYPETTPEQRSIYRKALAKLCARPWWERVWVRQEVAVANEATVHCGSDSCSFHALTVALTTLNTIDEELGFKFVLDSSDSTNASTDILRTTAYRRAYILTYYRSNAGHGPVATYQDLRTLILHTRSCAATDPRDKVFSVLGLADPDFWGLKADYRLSIKQTFITGAQTCILKKQSLDVLSGCQNPDQLNGLPSWVPNLTDGWKARPFPTTSQRHCEEVMASEAPDFSFKETEKGCVLKARGFLLDEIRTLSRETPHQDATSEELDTVSSAWRQLAATALQNPNIFVLDKGAIAKYKDDGPWIQFLSTHADNGKTLPRSASEVKILGDYRMAKSLLLPSEDEMAGIGDVKGFKTRVREHLRKNGVGRRLGITKMGEKKGSVVLVPAEAKEGDEIWMFRGTSFPYVLRRVENGYVVVGEAYSDRYYWPYLKQRTKEVARIISIF